MGTPALQPSPRIRVPGESFRALAESLPNIVARFDKHHRHVYVNQAVEEATGIPVSVWTGKSHRELGLPIAFAQMWEEAIDAVFVSNKPYSLSFNFPSPTGDRPFDVLLTPVTEHDECYVLAYATDKTSERTARADLEFLAQATRELLATLDVREVLRIATRRAAPYLADWASAVLVEGGRAERVETAHARPQHAHLVAPLLEAFPPTLQPGTMAARALATGDIILIRDLEAMLAAVPLHAHQKTLVESLQLRSGACVPLRAGVQTLGFLNLSFDALSGRTFDESRRPLLEAYASRVGSALSNALAYEAREHALAAERDLQDRLTLLAEAATRLVAKPGEDGFLGSIVGLSHRLVGADAYAVWRRDEKANVWRIIASHALSQDYRAVILASLEDEDTLLSRPLIISDVSASPLLAQSRDHQAREGIRSLAAFPLTANDTPFGTLVFYYKTPHTTTTTEERLGSLLANLTATTLVAQDAREALAEQHRLHAALLDAQARLGEGVILSQGRRHLFVNDAYCRMVGLSREELMAPDFDPWQLVHPDDRAAHVARQAARRPGEPTQESFDMRLVRKDGSSLTAHVSTANLGTDDARVSLLRDVTVERQRVAETEGLRTQLIEGEKLAALGSLVSGVAHELRTPLTFLGTNAFLAQHRVEQAAKRGATAADALAASQPFFMELAGGVDRINQLVEDLRRYTKTRRVAEKKEASVHVFVGDAILLFRATSRGIHPVEVSLGTTRAVLADTGAIQQVVLNLLQNAADASPSGAAIRVVTRQEGETPLIEVIDQGAGMSSAVIARMYEPLFTTKPEGSGLGLSIVKRIVEEHGARIECESAPGVGTTFRVRFP